MEMFVFSLKFHGTLYPKEPIVNKSALFQVMVWHWTGNKPLPEPMLIKISDAKDQQSLLLTLINFNPSMDM